jgi:hypothetical protein
VCGCRDKEADFFLVSSDGNNDDVVDDVVLLTDLPHAGEYHDISSKTHLLLSC